MKKIGLVFLTVLLTGSVWGQVPFKPERSTKIYERELNGSFEVYVETTLTDEKGNEYKGVHWLNGSLEEKEKITEETINVSNEKAENYKKAGVVSGNNSEGVMAFPDGSGDDKGGGMIGPIIVVIIGDKPDDRDPLKGLEGKKGSFLIQYGNLEQFDERLLSDLRVARKALR